MSPRTKELLETVIIAVASAAILAAIALLVSVIIE